MRWKFVVSEDPLIDFANGIRQSYFVTSDSEISFVNVTDGRLYVLKLIVSPSKKITWKNDNNIILKFASGTKYEENTSDEIDIVYLGFYAEETGTNAFTLNCIAMANEFEEIV